MPELTRRSFLDSAAAIALPAALPALFADERLVEQPARLISFPGSSLGTRN